MDIELIKRMMDACYQASESEICCRLCQMELHLLLFNIWISLKNWKNRVFE
ncbi:hypothetical protein [Ruminococcus sp. AM42-11]|uniref:hypothetical protein n=1 Tax=Ruminococcus sp. AM42-11 TaxID=2292372 RepID=UPI00325C1201